MPSNRNVLAVVQLIQLLTYRLSMVVGLHVFVWHYIEQGDKTSQHPRMSVEQGVRTIRRRTIRRGQFVADNSSQNISMLLGIFNVS